MSSHEESRVCLVNICVFLIIMCILQCLKDAFEHFRSELSRVMLLQTWLASTAPFYSNFSVQLGNSLFQLNFLRRLVKEIRSYFPLEPIFWQIQNLAENKYCQWIVKLCNIGFGVTEYLQTNCWGDVDEDLDTIVTCETSRLPSPFDVNAPLHA